MTVEEGPRDLLVASAGGHLTQLHLLAQRLEPQRPRTWVTYDHPQARSLLADEDVVVGHGPSSRSPQAAVRNWILSAAVVDPTRIARVVSTGSAISVPFLVRAERRGIEAHYIESATRVEGPSLSGRLLGRLTRHVGLHTQHPGWAGGRWQATGSVFDGFTVVETAGCGDRSLRVVVSLGTHDFPFPRLIAELEHVLLPGDEVLVQNGATRVGELPGRVTTVAAVPAARLREELSAADVVVAHAGTGIALTALGTGRVPVLLPRRAEHGEHVDDHQLQTAGTLATRGLAVTPSGTSLTRQDQLRAADRRAEQPERSCATLSLAGGTTRRGGVR